MIIESKSKLAGAVLTLVFSLAFLGFSIKTYIEEVNSPNQLAAVGAIETSFPLGINLSPHKDYTPVWPFINAMKQSREWIIGPLWGWETPGATMPLRADGYPLEVPYGGNIVRTLMFRELPYRYPAGTYTLSFEGSGEVFLGLDGGNKSYSVAGSYQFSPTPTEQGIMLEIRRSDSSNPIRNIKILMPGYTSDSGIFTTEFLNSLVGFKAVRFMDWMMTNSQELSRWSERTPKNYYTQTGMRGVAYEYMIELANRLNADIWVNIPHKADDDYVQQFATLLKNELNADRQIYIEYTNERWNYSPGFSQTQYVTDQGAILYPNDDMNHQNWKYYAKRSVEIFKIFQTVFGSGSRLVNVIGTNADFTLQSDWLLKYAKSAEFNPTGVKIDALATAPYFGHGPVSTSLDALFNELSGLISGNEIYDRTKRSKAVADAYGARLIAYEGGQHLRDASREALFKAANRDPRMEGLYDSLFSIWDTESGGGLFMAFNHIDKYDSAGFWGMKEYLDDNNNPKFLSIIKHLASDATTTPPIEPDPCSDCPCESCPTCPTCPTICPSIVYCPTVKLVKAPECPQGLLRCYKCAPVSF